MQRFKVVSSLLGSRNHRLLAAVGAAALLAGATVAWNFVSTQHLTRDNAWAAQLHQQLGAAQAAAASAVPAEPDFAQRLPDAPALEPVYAELQRSSQAAGVAVSSVTSSFRDATLQTLGRAELSVTLRGKYADIKTVLAEVRSRYPGLLLQRLSLRRLTSPTDVEARLDLLLLTRPLQGPTVAPS